MPLFDQIDDYGLDKLPALLNSFLPYSWYDMDINPIEDILPRILGNSMDGVNILFDEPPKAKVKVIDTPNGKAILGCIRKKHSSFISGKNNGTDMVIPSLIRQMMGQDDSPFALGNKFPVSDPSQALISLLYALGQKSEIGDDNFNNLVKPRIAGKLGDSTVNQIIDTVSKLKNGSEEIIDEDLKKKIIITVEDYAAANKDINDMDDDKLDKVVSNTDTESEEELPEEEKEKKIKKEAAIKYVMENDSRNHKRYYRLNKQAGRVQTSLFKLAGMLDTFKNLKDMPRFINLLKAAMINEKMFTIAAADIQEDFINKLSTIFKTIDDPQGDGFVKDLIYNTDLPNNTGEIIYIDATVNSYDKDSGEYNFEEIQAPIDTEKINNMSYEEASKALTATVADHFFDEDKTKIDIDKFKDFLEGIQTVHDNKEEKQEVIERIVEPVLLMFSPDNDVMENIGVPSEDIKKDKPSE